MRFVVAIKLRDANVGFTTKNLPIVFVLPRKSSSSFGDLHGLCLHSELHAVHSIDLCSCSALFTALHFLQVGRKTKPKFLGTSLLQSSKFSESEIRIRTGSMTTYLLASASMKRYAFVACINSNTILVCAYEGH